MWKQKCLALVLVGFLISELFVANVSPNEIKTGNKKKKSIFDLCSRGGKNEKISNTELNLFTPFPSEPSSKSSYESSSSLPIHELDARSHDYDPYLHRTNNHHSTLAQSSIPHTSSFASSHEDHAHSSPYITNEPSHIVESRVQKIEDRISANIPSPTVQESHSYDASSKQRPVSDMHQDSHSYDSSFDNKTYAVQEPSTIVGGRDLEFDDRLDANELPVIKSSSAFVHEPASLQVSPSAHQSNSILMNKRHQPLSYLDYDHALDDSHTMSGHEDLSHLRTYTDEGVASSVNSRNHQYEDNTKTNKLSHVPMPPVPLPPPMHHYNKVRQQPSKLISIPYHNKIKTNVNHHSAHTSSFASTQHDYASNGLSISVQGSVHSSPYTSNEPSTFVKSKVQEVEDRLNANGLRVPMPHPQLVHSNHLNQVQMPTYSYYDSDQHQMYGTGADNHAPVPSSNYHRTLHEPQSNLPIRSTHEVPLSPGQESVQHRENFINVKKSKMPVLKPVTKHTPDHTTKHEPEPENLSFKQKLALFESKARNEQ